MAENSQLSGNMENSSTGTSSTDASSETIGKHENEIVPHKISNHDKLVQTMVMVDGEWINVNDTNDQANMKDDMNKVNKKVVEAQKGIVEAKSAADSAAKAADSAVSASVVNSDAITAQSAAISETKSAISSATAAIQQTAANAASDAAKIRADVAQVQSEVDTAKAANSATVEALKSDVSAAKQDIQAARQANENVAKQLDDYTKQAQAQGKTIKDIQDAQNGYTATLADVKGNVSKISDAVDGLSASLKDDQDNVATIKVKADELSATLNDHDKNIAQLAASAKELSSTLEDADGRLSKVEQTASTLVNEFADQQGHLNRVEQTAQGTEQTVANQQGQINDIKTDAAGIHQALTGQGNQIANINVTLNGLNTKYEGVSGDLGKLSDKITTNSTQITQNKKEIDLKADQSTVDNLTGEVSQNKAQLKVQADQISSKVSSTEYQTLKGKVDGMQIGGRNYLRDSNKSVSSYMQDLGTMPDDVMTSLAGKTITVSADVEWNNFVKDSNVQNRLGFEIAVHRSDGLDQWFGTWKYPTTSNGRERISSTFNVPAGLTFTVANNGQNGYVNMEGTGIVSHAKVEIGTTATDWTPAPEDTITAIQKNSTAIDQTNQKISLKADQTEVDQVKQTATQNSSRLDVMANEISSKVTSTDVNNIVESKGYATTSTVQSLITQKAGTINESITNLTSEVNSNNGGGVNFAKNTINASYSGNSGSGKIGDISLEDMNELRGQTITLSVDVEWTGWQSASGANRIGWELQVVYADGSTVNNWLGVWAIPTTASGKQRVSATYTIPDKEITSLGEGAVFVQANCTSAKVSRLKIERGSVATPYSPSPSDEATVTQVQQLTASIDGLQSNVANKADKSQITQLSNVIQSKVSSSDFNNLRKAVDLQMLDSADINNMKTNGHYFVHNLANNPVGGWVYVDVTGNGADRIRQDVYQDSGNQHKYRRWFGDSWTAWSQGATESEITQLRDDINLRVKSGDLLSQINIQAGHTLIQSNKIYFDADSFVMSPNSKAFIPSAFITNLSADKITTGTLDASKLHVKNFSADNISGGTLSGITVKTGDKNRYFQTSKDSIYWVRDNKTSLIGTDQYINPSDGIVIADTHSVTLTTWYGATVKEDGTITNEAGNIGYPKLILDSDGKWDPDASGGSNWEGNTGKAQIGQWIADKEYTTLVQGKGFEVRLNDQNSKSIFTIQKDNCIGAYFGQGERGNQININAGDVNITGNFHVTGSKNSIVETKQGYLAINAYETAEYYFGDIGESNTGASGKVIVGIDKIFNETVNTDIQYQVFLTSYGNARLWVSKRYNNRFVVESDTPNAEFGWELKAKRKGYEGNRLRVVHGDFDNPELLKGSTN